MNAPGHVRELAGVAATVLFAACSSSSSGPFAAADAGRGATVDAGHDGGSSGFPVDDSGPAVDAAATECDTLRKQATDLQITAKGCNPQGANECAASVDGICCPITVSFENQQAVNDFQQAVLAYKAKCQVDCSTVICGGTPSNKCIAGAAPSTGSCE
jgi:hypothetical protein